MKPSPKTPLIAGLAVMTILALVLYWKQTRRVQALETAALAATGREAELQRQLDALAQRRADLEGRLSSGRGAPRSHPISAGSAAPASPALRPVPLPAMNDAVLQRSLMASIRGSLDLRYASLFRRLKLPADQLNRLKNLLVDRQVAVLDVLAAARSQGLTGPEHAQEIRGLVQQTQDEVDAQIQELLGAENFSRYRDHHSLAPYYAVAEQLERRLSYTDSPLSPEQLEELAQIIRAETSPESNPPGGNTLVAAGPGGRFMSGPIISTNISPISDGVVERAGRTLSPAQLEALRQLQSEQHDQQAMAGPMPLAPAAEATAIPFSPAPSGAPGLMPSR